MKICRNKSAQLSANIVNFYDWSVWRGLANRTVEYSYYFYWNCFPKNCCLQDTCLTNHELPGITNHFMIQNTAAYYIMINSTTNNL